MSFSQIQSVDFRVGIWVDSPVLKDAGTSKKDREKAGQLQLINNLFPNDEPLWGYEESGKPYFINRAENLSFSHSENVYACQVSEKIACGIDVQHYREKILRVPEKFLNQTELDFVNQTSTDKKLKVLTAMWSCKETLYKMHGQGFIDYLNLFTIHPFEPVSGMLSATADLGNGNKTYHIHVEFTDTFVLAFHTLLPLLPANDKRILDI